MPNTPFQKRADWLQHYREHFTVIFGDLRPAAPLVAPWPGAAPTVPAAPQVAPRWRVTARVKAPPGLQDDPGAALWDQQESAVAPAPDLPASWPMEASPAPTRTEPLAPISAPTPPQPVPNWQAAPDASQSAAQADVVPTGWAPSPAPQPTEPVPSATPPYFTPVAAPPAALSPAPQGGSPVGVPAPDGYPGPPTPLEPRLPGEVEAERRAAAARRPSGQLSFSELLAFRQQASDATPSAPASPAPFGALGDVWQRDEGPATSDHNASGATNVTTGQTFRSPPPVFDPALVVPDLKDQLQGATSTVAPQVTATAHAEQTGSPAPTAPMPAVPPQDAVGAVQARAAAQPTLPTRDEASPADVAAVSEPVSAARPHIPIATPGVPPAPIQPRPDVAQERIEANAEFDGGEAPVPPYMATPAIGDPAGAVVNTPTAAFAVPPEPNVQPQTPITANAAGTEPPAREAAMRAPEPANAGSSPAEQAAVEDGPPVGFNEPYRAVDTDFRAAALRAAGPVSPDVQVILPRRARPVPFVPGGKKAPEPELPAHSEAQVQGWLSRLNRVAEGEASGGVQGRPLSLAELLTWDRDHSRTAGAPDAQDAPPQDAVGGTTVEVVSVPNAAPTAEGHPAEVMASQDAQPTPVNAPGFLPADVPSAHPLPASVSETAGWAPLPPQAPVTTQGQASPIPGVKVARIKQPDAPALDRAAPNSPSIGPRAPATQNPAQATARQTAAPTEGRDDGRPAPATPTELSAAGVPASPLSGPELSPSNADFQGLAEASVQSSAPGATESLAPGPEQSALHPPAPSVRGDLEVSAAQPSEAALLARATAPSEQSGASSLSGGLAQTQAATEVNSGPPALTRERDAVPDAPSIVDAQAAQQALSAATPVTSVTPATGAVQPDQSTPASDLDTTPHAAPAHDAAQSNQPPPSASDLGTRSLAVSIPRAADSHTERTSPEGRADLRAAIPDAPMPTQVAGDITVASTQPETVGEVATPGWDDRSTAASEPGARPMAVPPVQAEASAAPSSNDASPDSLPPVGFNEPYRAVDTDFRAAALRAAGPVSPDVQVILPRRARPVPFVPGGKKAPEPELPAHSEAQVQGWLSRLNRVAEGEASGGVQGRPLSLAELLTWDRDHPRTASTPDAQDPPPHNEVGDTTAPAAASPEVGAPHAVTETLPTSPLNEAASLPQHAAPSLVNGSPAPAPGVPAPVMPHLQQPAQTARAAAQDAPPVPPAKAAPARPAPPTIDRPDAGPATPAMPPQTDIRASVAPVVPLKAQIPEDSPRHEATPVRSAEAAVAPTPAAPSASAVMPDASQADAPNVGTERPKAAGVRGSAGAPAADAGPIVNAALPVVGPARIADPVSAAPLPVPGLQRVRSRARVERALAQPEAREPLPLQARARLAPLLGADVSGVHVVRDARAAEAVAEVGADALAVGDTVLLGAGQDLSSPQSLALLAHELTHVLRERQPGFVPASVRRQTRSARLDEETLAERVEGQVRQRLQAARPAESPRPTAGAAPSPSEWNGLPAPWDPMPHWEAPATNEAPRQAAPRAAAAAPAPLASAPAAPAAAAPFASGARAASSARSVASSDSGSDSAGAGGSEVAQGPAVGFDHRKTNRNAPDLDRLAVQIYAILKRRLSDEMRRIR